MKFFFKNEKSLKNGLYLDYYFKNIVFFFYKKILGNNLLILLERYLTEKCFFFFNSFFNYLNIFINSIKYLNFNQILKIILITMFHIFLIILL